MFMLIEVKDLQVGDEIIVPLHSQFKYLKVLKPIKLKKRGATKRWITRNPLYAGIWCSTRREVVTVPYGGTNYTRKEYICTSEGHNLEKYENLNYKNIWLVKRGTT